MTTSYYVILGENLLDRINVPDTEAFTWEELESYAKATYGEQAMLISEHNRERYLLRDVFE